MLDESYMGIMTETCRLLQYLRSYRHSGDEACNCLLGPYIGAYRDNGKWKLL